MKNIIKKILCATLLAAGCALANAADEISVIPQPQHLERTGGEFSLPSEFVIASDAASQETAKFLADRLRRATGYSIKTAVRKGLLQSQPGDFIFLTTENPRPELGAEGYDLIVGPPAITIHASTQAGLFYGMQTLLQLLPPEIYSDKPVKNFDWKIPAVEITDVPRFQWRGLLVDVSRHFLTVDELKKIIDVMAVHKFNTLHLHLTDDQGWRLEIKKYPRLTKLGSVRAESPQPGNRKEGDGTPYGPYFYTQKQIRDLVAYAQARHITIVPEIEMPGHLLGVLTAYPELSCTGGSFYVRTKWGVEKDVLCIGNTNGIAFMENVLTEVLDLFPSQFIHIGGDEVPRDRWMACEKCQALMKTEGMTNAAQLQTWFNHHIETFLASKGRRMIGWDEILEGGLTPGAAVMSWRGVDGGIKAASAGHDVVMSPNSHLYLDHAQAKSPGEPETIGGYLPLNKVYSYEPVPSQLAPDMVGHILGAQGNLWSEYFYGTTLKKFEYQAYPRAAALAEVAWSPKDARNFDDFYRRLQTHVKRLDELDVNYRHLDAATVDNGKPQSK
jgi:hexosaminidase